MPDQEREQRNRSAVSTVSAAVRTGKAVSNITKGAAAGGIYGAAVAAAGSVKKWIVPLLALLFLPVVLVSMLPSIIFGPVFSDGSARKSGISDDSVLDQNLRELNEQISGVLSAGLTQTISDIEEDYLSSGCDDYEINNPYGSDIRFNANSFISLYCAGKNADSASISASDLVSVLLASKEKLYSYTYEDEERTVDGEIDEETGEAEQIEITVRVYTIQYNGEMYFSDEVFRLDDKQKALASEYTKNLTFFLNDGCYQVIPASEFSDPDYCYDGVVFADGQTEVVYYNQYDERWRDLPYGTDNIGGYACGPTSMAIVISSLTDETVDPPTMARWAYENGHWCSGSGSYRSVVSGACEAWGLSVSKCPREDPQKLIDALAGGNLVVAIMGPGHFTKGGHYIVLRGVTSGGKILVADPASYTRSEQEWDLAIITAEASWYSQSDPPFWIIGS